MTWAFGMFSFSFAKSVLESINLWADSWLFVDLEFGLSWYFFFIRRVVLVLGLFLAPAISTQPSSCPDVWLKRSRVILLINYLESPFFLEISIEVEEIQTKSFSIQPGCRTRSMRYWIQLACGIGASFVFLALKNKYEWAHAWELKPSNNPPDRQTSVWGSGRAFWIEFMK